jgi:hypothetical protein
MTEERAIWIDLTEMEEFLINHLKEKYDLSEVEVNIDIISIKK